MKLKLLLAFGCTFLFSVTANCETFTSWKIIDQFYKHNNIDINNLQKSQINRMIMIKSIPLDFADLKDVKKKKEIFFLIAYPLIFKSNRDIKVERKVVSDIEKKYKRNEMNENDKSNLVDLAKKYNLDFTSIDRSFFKKMKQRINVIPISLALGQAILESGWGQSRFAIEGNALYGQWTFDQQKGLIPQNRDPDKTHAVKKFDLLEESVKSYMFNLNTHPAYYEFRVVRRVAELLGVSKNAINYKMQQLAAYAEIRGEYIDKLELIVDSNNLTKFDNIN